MNEPDQKPFSLFCSKRLRVVFSQYMTEPESRSFNLHLIKSKCGHLRFILPERFKAASETADAGGGAGSLPSIRRYTIKK